MKTIQKFLQEENDDVLSSPDIDDYIQKYMIDDSDVPYEYKMIIPPGITIIDGEPVPTEVVNRGPNDTYAYLAKVRKKQKMRKLAS